MVIVLGFQKTLSSPFTRTLFRNLQTKKDSKVLGQHKSFTELTTQKAGVLFTSKKLRALSLDYAQTREQYNRTQSTLVQEVVGIAGEVLYAPRLYLN